MPCHLCTGAIIQFNIRKVVVGEKENFTGAEVHLRAHGVEVVTLDLPECKQMMREFIINHPNLWNEDIGQL